MDTLIMAHLIKYDFWLSIILSQLNISQSRHVHFSEHMNMSDI
jgi:hypothetical protein